ncbi:MAG: hypothetical protein ABI346_10680 [Candidatus Baltobacteraceae bacterium]
MLGAAFAFGVPHASRAAIETDPTALYATMKQAYDRGGVSGWRFVDELNYFSAILDAGRAYSLFRPQDPAYAEIADLTVDVASRLHYDPLTNNDAAAWYVREAATYVSTHGDATRVPDANALLAKLSAGEADTKQAARDAQIDAAANAKTWQHDPDAAVESIVADVRAYNLTRDPTFRSDALQRANSPAMPLLRIPDPEFAEFFQFAEAGAQGSDATYSAADVANAKAIAARRKNTPELQVIGTVRGIPHELRLTRTAPADEYFGNLKMSPLGVHNDVVRLQKYLDAGWGARMTDAAANVTDAIDDWQKQYPHDLTLPRNLYELYQQLVRIDSDRARAEAEHVRNVLLVQYPTSNQARQISTS